MIIKHIIITCPKCKHEFGGSILLSIGPGCPIKKDDELFSNIRKCEECSFDVDIYNGNNGGHAFRFPIEPLSRRIKKWFEKFLP